MYLVVGLGNPEAVYRNTPHNAGVLFVRTLAKEYAFPEFRELKSVQALTSKGSIEETPVTLVLPQTYMNDSGSSLFNLAKKHPKMLVAHDDIDLPLGTYKYSEDRGAAGHKGVLSVIEALGTKAFPRLRLGVCPLEGKPELLEKYVVQKLSPEQQELLEHAAKEALKELPARLG